MKFVSDYTGEVFDTVEACAQHEAEFEAKTKEKNRAMDEDLSNLQVAVDKYYAHKQDLGDFIDKIDSLRKEVDEMAQNICEERYTIQDQMKKFCKIYGKTIILRDKKIEIA